MACSGDGSTGDRTQNWLFSNWARTRRLVVPTTYNPATVQQIVAAVQDAEREGGSLKAVGSGWSYSGVAVDESTTHVINTDLLTGLVGGESVIPIALKDELQPRARYYIEVKAGTKVHVVNCLLDGLGLAMRTLGGSNGQSIAGALSTGTHGADVNLPPIADNVRAIHLVGPGGQEWWIERDGDRSLTDPDRMQRFSQFGPLCSSIRIERDTPLFRSVLVSLGRMGVVYSYVFEVVDAFLLTETRHASTWSERQAYIRAKVQTPVASYTGTRFLEIILNPYPQADGDHACVYSNRELSTATTPDAEMPAAKGAFETFCEMESLTQILVGVQVALPGLIGAATAAAVAGLAPLAAIPVVGPAIVATATPIVVGAATAGLVLLEGALASLLAASPGGNFADQLANVCNLATAVGQKQIVPQLISALTPTFRDPNTPAQTRESFRILTGQGPCGTPRVEEAECQRSIDGLEFALDVSPGSNNLFGFINEVFGLTDTLYASNTPVGFVMSLRFCTGTDAILGMQQFPRTCSVEFIMLRGFVGLETFKLRLYEIARRNGAIPHWGLIHELPASQVRVLYPELSTWRQSLQYLINGGNGNAATFRSVFSTTRGLEPEAVQPPEVVVADEQTGETYPYDFGTCSLHTRKSVTFHFANTGQGTLRISSVNADGSFRAEDVPASAFLGTPGTPRNLDLTVTRAEALRGEEIEVFATFVAQESGRHTGFLTIFTNAGNVATRQIKIPIRAMVEAVDVRVLQPAPNTPLDLGSGGIGEYRFGTLVVRNSGTVAMLLDSFTVASAAAIPQLNVERGPLAVGQLRTYMVTYVPTQVGRLSTDLTLHFTDGISPSRVSQDVVVRVTGVGVGAQAGFSPATMDFGEAVIGTETAARTILVENTGQQSLTITGTLLGPDFVLRGPLPSSVPGGQSGSVVVAFAPGHEGELVSSFTITSNSVQAPNPVVLQGTGVARVLLVASPASLQFGETAVGGRSGERIVSIQNRGALPASLTSISIVGTDNADFTIVGNTCGGTTLGPENRCEVRLVMAPGTAGDKNALLQVLFSGPGAPLHVPLAGDAVLAQGLRPSTSELDFGRVPLGVAARPIKVAIENAGTAAATVQAVTIAPGNAGDFALVSDECTGATLAPGATCGLAIAARAQAVGELTANVSIQATAPALGIALHAVGVAARMEWSVPNQDFGAIRIGGRSPKQDVQLFNTGDITLIVTSIAVDGDFEIIDIVPTVNAILPNQAKYFSVWFLPTAAGPRTGSVTVICDPLGGTYVLPLAGVGSPPR